MNTRRAASLHGVEIPQALWHQGLINATGKKHLRLAIRREGIRWKDEPAWQQLSHDIQVCDLRLTVQAATERAGLTFNQWITEGDFRAYPDKVTVRIHENDRNIVMEHSVIPDGFFVVVREASDEAFAYLVELDRSTQEGPRFLQRHVLPGIAYLESEAYQRRTGLRYGRWLVITTGPTRVANLKRAAEQVTRKSYFYFTHSALVTARSFFTEPIWQLVGHDKPIALLPAR